MRWVRFTVKKEEFLPLRKTEWLWMCDCSHAGDVWLVIRSCWWSGLTDHHFSFCVFSQLTVDLTHSSVFTTVVTQCCPLDEALEMLTSAFLADSEKTIEPHFNRQRKIQIKWQTKNITFNCLPDWPVLQIRKTEVIHLKGANNIISATIDLH